MLLIRLLLFFVICKNIKHRPTMNDAHLALLVNTVQQLSQARDIDTVTTIVRTAARKLTGADGATFVLRDNDQCYYADEDAIAPLWKGQRFPMSACISGWAMQHKQHVVIEDIYKDSRVPIEAYNPTFVKSVLMVPIHTVAPIGAIGNYWASNHLPPSEEIHLLQSLADITSVSIENVYVYNELEERVKQRTHELEEINKELEAFSYSVSHDLRGPLRSVIGKLHFLLQDYSDKTLDISGQNDVKSIVDAAKNMDELIKNLLEFSKSGKQPLKLCELQMKKMVVDICNELSQQETERAILFNINDIPDARGDEVLIRQVWVNLLSNAVKYTSKKEQTEITVGALPAENGITYYVKDNGAGFDMQYYDKLFGIFERLHGAGEFKGNGVGLALVQRILERHGGTIWANSAVGEGSQFSFTLPL